MPKFKQSCLGYSFVLALIMSFMSLASQSEETFVDVFNETSSWRFIGDSVMGGVSTGSIFFETNESISTEHLFFPAIQILYIK